jgi:hypothetical protein
MHDASTATAAEEEELDQEELKDLGVVSLNGFSSAITRSEVLTSVFARVDISGLDICEDEGERTRADTLNGKIWERTQFRFLCVSLCSCPT